MLLGIDYGISKVGIAVIDESQNTPAVPVAVLTLHPDHLFYDTFTEVLEDYAPKEIIVGNPFTNFSPSQEDKDAFERFLSIIRRVSKKSLFLFDETGTTREAQHLIKMHPQKIKNDDAIAASIMLDAYVQKKKNASIS